MPAPVFDPAALRAILADPLRFSAELGGVKLRAYQEIVARAVVDSVLHRRGLSFAVMFPRQSGKNELQAQIECYLLLLFCRAGAEMVKISPTLRPQGINAMRRLERALRANQLTRSAWKKEAGRACRLGRARITFLSGAPGANIVGATAATLLEIDEAQDLRIDKYDREIAPMAASTNATRVFWGTAWTDQTLLARELDLARRLDVSDPRPFPRAYVLDAPAVAREVPAYGLFVAEQVARFGRSHPLVRTQFFSETIAGGGGMFPAWRLDLIFPAQPLSAPEPDAPGTVALLLDVAGEGEEYAGRDATALTVVQIDPASLADPLLRAPTYRVISRRAWVGAAHAAIYAEILALAGSHRARWLVVDATGVGAGLASFLERALPGRVIPFVFNQASKSRLGWGFLGVVDSGRWREAFPLADLENAPPAAGGENKNFHLLPGFVGQPPTSAQQGYAAAFLQQLRACQYTLSPGPARIMQWGVPAASRDPHTGAPLHDDWITSAALCCLLDDLPWGLPAGSADRLVRAADPLDDMVGF